MSPPFDDLREPSAAAALSCGVSSAFLFILFAVFLSSTADIDAALWD